MGTWPPGSQGPWLRPQRQPVVRLAGSEPSGHCRVWLLLKFSCDGKFLLITSRLVVDSGSSRQSSPEGLGHPQPSSLNTGTRFLGGMEGPCTPSLRERAQSPSHATGGTHVRLWATSIGSAPTRTVLHRTPNFPCSTAKMENVELISL